MSREHVFKRLVIFGDSYGIPMLLKNLPAENVVGLVAAEIRPDDIDSIKSLAERYHLPFILQPRFTNSNYPSFVDSISKLQADLLICNSYSMLIRSDILDLVSGQAVNVHCSLLPRHRGPNPIQWALIHGDKETGVTIHYMSPTIDSGDIIAQKKIEITDEATWVTLRVSLSLLTESILREYLPQILSGANSRRVQDEQKAILNKRLNSESPRIDFKMMTDRQVFNLIRAQVSPLRGAFVETSQGRKYFSESISLAEVANLRAGK